ncbi:MAG: protein-methionine-sulfoxide reductase catalytic subunit MsrP [Myxococcota bacterium]
MVLLRFRARGQLRESGVTPEQLALSRRELVAGLAALGLGCTTSRPVVTPTTPPPPTPVQRAPCTLDRPLTDEKLAATHNNFYEFSPDKGRVWQLAQGLRTHPWTVEVAGLTHRARVVDVEELTRALVLEERCYRFRCVEAWSMAVPWVGVPLRSVLERLRPLASARYVRFQSFYRPSVASGQKGQFWYPWPYFEALRLDEAYHPLALWAVGIYGHTLPPQHGAPVRVVVPWKYGFKSIKSVVKVEFTVEQPRTFWSSVAPAEYDFWANVDPTVPHPRWSQATERMLGERERRPTLPFNGYADEVASLYAAR